MRCTFYGMTSMKILLNEHLLVFYYMTYSLLRWAFDQKVLLVFYVTTPCSSMRRIISPCYILMYSALCLYVLIYELETNVFRSGLSDWLERMKNLDWSSQFGLNVRRFKISIKLSSKLTMVNINLHKWQEFELYQFA